MSDQNEPVAWHVVGENYEQVTLLREHALAIHSERSGQVTPLYRSPALTDAERRALAFYSRFDTPQNGPVVGGHAATLRGLLERLGKEVSDE